MSVPALAEVRSGGEENTGVLIERLWEATSDWSLVTEDGSPPALAEVPDRRWWPWVVAALALTAAAVVTVWVRTLPAKAGAEWRTAAITAVSDAQISIEGARQIIDLIVDPSIGDLSEAAAGLADLDRASRQLGSVAAARPQGGWDTAADLMVASAEDGVAIERQLGAAVTYRLQLAGTFALPRLPSVADELAVTELAAQLATAIESARVSAEQLPRNPFLDPHRLAVAETVAHLDVLQVRYLTALRDGDQPEAKRNAQNMTDAVAEVLAAAEVPFAQLVARTSVLLDSSTAQLDDLNDALGD